MKFLMFVLILATIWTQAEAQDPHNQPSVTSTSVTEVTEVTNITSADGNYGLMALSASGLVFGCCRPDTLQWAVAGAFTEGGNQSFTAGLATNFGPVLLNARFAAIIGSPNKENDYAVIVGGSGAFK